ncbi:hypothetical protein CIRG_05191 [Coccidioides immitis RMSCC 2394]|uniref:Immediate-early protein n=1 Tax=Coccidioides immitis RMSCC 2394 TaxID=404692 RepID=A0A0J6YCV2_COCIT|nr:hypothetical protein CIRG_05191 [Coccidioides immitis RMSCC 2394]
MFSHIVTAARGLFSSSDSSHRQSNSSRGAENTDPQTMPVATRRSILSQSEDFSSRNSSPAANGKRKKNLLTTEAAQEPTPKRRRGQRADGTKSQSNTPQPNGVPKRRYQVLEAVEIRSESRPGTRESSVATPRASVKPDEPFPGTVSKTKTAHLRFDSEEPQLELNGVQEDDIKENEAESQQQEEEMSDDDEAPEAVSNTKQLQELREAERRKEEAKQRQEQMKKEKRREHEKRLKLQAKFKPAPVEFATPSKPLPASKQEEILSESSATLQGSEVKAQSSSFLLTSLPKFLPDEILLAEPPVRPPTPPRDVEKPSMALKPSGNKLRFLDTVEKKPKDVRLGAMSIRVLEDSHSAAGGKTDLHNSLPPKASKKGRTIRESWMAGNRRGVSAVHGGLRRTTGGPSGFLRK